uniref:hypothetical protein n=1 Tax=Candidatus Fimivicinus sp. TaxID=3056640 RepID=UPI003FEF958C
MQIHAQPPSPALFEEFASDCGLCAPHDISQKQRRIPVWAGIRLLFINVISQKYQSP